MLLKKIRGLHFSGLERQLLACHVDLLTSISLAISTRLMPQIGRPRFPSSFRIWPVATVLLQGRPCWHAGWLQLVFKGCGCYSFSKVRIKIWGSSEKYRILTINRMNIDILIIAMFKHMHTTFLTSGPPVLIGHCFLTSDSRGVSWGRSSKYRHTVTCSLGETFDHHVTWSTSETSTSTFWFFVSFSWNSILGRKTKIRCPMTLNLGLFSLRLLPIPPCIRTVNHRIR